MSTAIATLPSKTSGSIGGRATTSKAKKPYRTIRLIDIMLTLMAIELLAGGIIVARELIEARKVREQITQIARFDSSVSVFESKFGGLPGDLLSAQAERMGLPTGDGTPGHSDGDGKISPCSPHWVESLGCESALFWAQLASSELIPGVFTGNTRFADSRVQETDLLSYYLPQSIIAQDLYFMVWNSDHIMLSSGKYLPNGNYYQLTAIHGIEDGKLKNDPHALSPLVAKEIDEKIDDGDPFAGNIIVNGTANTETGGWDHFAEMDPMECITPDATYNIGEYLKAHRPLCHLAIAINAE